MKKELTIQELIYQTNHYYQELLGYSVKETNLSIDSNLNKEQKNGYYLVRSQTSVIPNEDRLALFHEYFGHGLFCEQSLAGKELVNLEKALLQEEKGYFRGKKFSLEELKNFRAQNKISLRLRELANKELNLYEKFAIFSEYALSKEFNLMSLFEKRYSRLSEQDREKIDGIILFSKYNGDLATFYSFGLARKTTQKRVKKLLEDVYAKGPMDNSKLVLLTGSKKPFSDIDVFSSSDYLEPIKNDWLDSVVFNERDFERRINLFEVQITHPIFAGEFIGGDLDYFKEKRKQLLKQQITPEAIRHNFKRSEENKESALNYPESSSERKTGLSYAKTYLANAIALKNGKRLFTKEKLESYLQNEKFIELKENKI